MTDIIVRKRVRSFQKARCTNPECGSTKLHRHRENAHYNAFRCHECGQFIVEGNVDLFTMHETEINQQVARAAILDEAGALVREMQGAGG